MPTHSFQLLEASWEVCNKVGGIHTVITSKISHAQASNYTGYLAIGPYFPQATNPAFQEEELPVALRGIATLLEKRGVSLHYGTWITEGEPPTILLGWEGLIGQMNGFKSQFWDHYGLDTLGSNFYDVDEPLIWSIAVGMFVEAYASVHPTPIVLQAHEWLAAGAILWIKQNQPSHLKTVFTTHATVLGRALASNGGPLYDDLVSIKPEEEARRLGVYTKHQLEKLAATHATVFTTVSHLTDEEATHFLARPADVILQNGLDTAAFPVFDELCRQYTEMREALHDFTSAYFFPSQQFDLEKTTYQFTMGRYELHNKGYDSYLQSLGILNNQLKEEKSDKTIISFFLVHGDMIRLRPDVTRKLHLYRQIQERLTRAFPQQRHTLYQQIIADKIQADPVVADLAKSLHSITRQLINHSDPPLSPFDLRNSDNDALIKTARNQNLLNRAEDRVKVVYFPCYLDGLDGIFNRPLYDIVSGFDLGVFPSYYEPWGYTPMESLILGVPAITSDLAGFGRALIHSGATPPAGIFMLDRRSKTDETTVNSLLDFLKISINEDKRAWMLRRISAYLSIQEFGWDQLYPNYTQAYNLAWGNSSVPEKN